MDNNGKRDLRVFYDQQDFKYVFLRIATNIKILDFDHPDDLLAFQKLPKILRDEIKNNMKSISNGYQIFSNEEYFNRYHAILFTHGKKQWIGIFQDIKSSVNIRALLISIGIGIGSMLFLFSILKYSNDTQKQIHAINSQLATHNSSQYNDISGINAFFFGNHSWGISLTLSIVSPILAFFGFQNWLSVYDDKYNKFVAASILKKLEDISIPQ